MSHLTNFGWDSSSDESVAFEPEAGGWDPSDIYKQLETQRISVVIRKRPLQVWEEEKGERDLFEVRSGQAAVLWEPRVKVDGTPFTQCHAFRADCVFDSNTSNEALYGVCVHPLLIQALGGVSASVFAYGQTGSGKSFTMLGSQPYGRGAVAGLFELASHDVWALLNNNSAYLTYFEIYQGRLYDLLNGRRQVRALENAEKEVVIPDLKCIEIEGQQQLLDCMIKGTELRQIGANALNDESSRSHAILTIQFRKSTGGGRPGKLTFVDLAGTERGKDAISSNQEGATINQSLLALKECIRAMDAGKKHIPFRNCELTKVLRDIFVGNCKSTMIACLSPSDGCVEQSLNTLRYATKVKNFHSGKKEGSSRPESRGAAVRPQTRERPPTRDKSAVKRPQSSQVGMPPRGNAIRGVTPQKDAPSRDTPIREAPPIQPTTSSSSIYSQQKKSDLSSLLQGTTLRVSSLKQDRYNEYIGKLEGGGGSRKDRLELTLRSLVAPKLVGQIIDINSVEGILGWNKGELNDMAMAAAKRHAQALQKVRHVIGDVKNIGTVDAGDPQTSPQVKALYSQIRLISNDLLYQITQLNDMVTTSQDWAILHYFFQNEIDII